MIAGIDASVALADELLASHGDNAVAANAPGDGRGLYEYLCRGLAGEPLDGPPGPFATLTARLLTRLSIWWPPEGLSRIPIMVPWAIRDRSARYDAGPESWGAPRADGYLRDDNSIIKKLPLPLKIAAPRTHPYSGRRPWRGFTACHIWRILGDGAIAGADPWLYSFMPNLVWLPSQLAPLSDRHESHVQLMLQRTALSIFGEACVAPSLAPYVSYAWARLPVPSRGWALSTPELAYFDVDEAFVRRRVAYLDRFVRGADEVLENGRLDRKIVCSRYTTGLPLVDRDAVTRLRDELHRYRVAVDRAGSRMTAMSESFDPLTEGPSNSPDSALEEVFAELLRLDPDGSRWSRVIRHTYDVIYNGQETGRYRWDQLMKTEKTHFGTLFEINAQREFGFDGGDATDYRIAGHEVDAKWSQTAGGWMLPPEVFGRLALVATGSDQQSTWSLGLVRVTEEARREGANRDKKSQLNERGRRSIRWLFRDAPLKPNVLLRLPPGRVDFIFAGRSGTLRTDQLFRETEGMIVHRNTVATVSRQLDHQKRVRYNGGSRSALAPEGYVILSGVYHSELARQLGVLVPDRDEYISVRVVPADGTEGVLIGHRRWRRALPGERVTVPAPRIDD